MRSSTSAIHASTGISLSQEGSRLSENKAEDTYVTELESQFLKLAPCGVDLSKDVKINVEEEKLNIAKQYRDYLYSKYNVERPKKKEEVKESSWFEGSKWILFGVLSCGGLIYNGFDDFLGGESLLDLVPGLSNAYVFWLSVGACFIDAILYYAFQTNLIKKELGLSSYSENHSLLEIYEERMDVVNDIIAFLFEIQGPGKTHREVDINEYFAFCSFAKMLHTDIMNKNVKMQFPEDTSTRWLRWSLTAFGAFMYAGGTYFTAASFLSAVAPTLIGTAVGAGISMALVGISVLNFFYMQTESIFTFLNPTFKKFEKIKKKLEMFSAKNDIDNLEGTYINVALQHMYLNDVKALQAENKQLKEVNSKLQSEAKSDDVSDYRHSPGLGF